MDPRYQDTQSWNRSEEEHNVSSNERTMQRPYNNIGAVNPSIQANTNQFMHNSAKPIHEQSSMSQSTAPFPATSFHYPPMSVQNQIPIAQKPFQMQQSNFHQPPIPTQSNATPGLTSGVFRPGMPLTQPPQPPQPPQFLAGQFTVSGPPINPPKSTITSNQMSYPPVSKFQLNGQPLDASQPSQYAPSQFTNSYQSTIGPPPQPPKFSHLQGGTPIPQGTIVQPPPVSGALSLQRPPGPPTFQSVASSQGSVPHPQRELNNGHFTQAAHQPPLAPPPIQPYSGPPTSTGYEYANTNVPRSYPQETKDPASVPADNSFNEQTTLGNNLQTPSYQQMQQQYQQRQQQQQQQLPQSPSASPGRIGRKNSRIDPSQLPRPASVLQPFIYHTNSGTVTSSGRKIPPLSNSIFRVVDTGNCSPRYLRVTTTAPGITKDIINLTGIPLAISTTPFASPMFGEDPVPVVNYGESPPRCSRCKAYVNTHVKWLDDGLTWICNLCQKSNETPKWYQCSLDGAGSRLDAKQRYELSLGSVDFVVGKDFSVRPPQEPLLIFAIDTSPRAISSGFTMASIQAIKSNINHLLHLQQQQQSGPLNGNALKSFGNASTGSLPSFYPPPSNAANISKSMSTGTVSSSDQFADRVSNSNRSDGIRVGIITFDRHIQYYQITELQSQDPIIKVLISDSEDPFATLPADSWILPIKDKAHLLMFLLDKILTLIPSLQGFDQDGYISNGGGYSPRSGTKQAKDIDAIDDFYMTCPVAAIKSIQLTLKDSGGKIFLFTSFSPTTGYGVISKSREVAQYYGTNLELYLYANASTASSLSLPSSTTSTSAVNPNAPVVMDEKQLLQLYQDVSSECAKSYVSVDIFIHHSPSIDPMTGLESTESTGLQHPNYSLFPDYALLSEITEATGGNFHVVNGSLNSLLSNEEPLESKTEYELKGLEVDRYVYVYTRDNYIRLLDQLKHSSQSISGYEVSMKLRCSVGFFCEKILGRGNYDETLGELQVPCVNSDTSFCILYNHETAASTFSALTSSTSLKEDDKIYFQLAVLHTSPITRQRLVRVHNLAVNATLSALQVFRHADFDCVIDCLVKVAVDKALKLPLNTGLEQKSTMLGLSTSNIGPKAYLNEKALEILFKYRVNCSADSARQQLILPESLKLLPLYHLGTLKHPMLLENDNNTLTAKTYTVVSKVQMRAYERAYQLRKFRSLPCHLVVSSIYPRLFALHQLAADEGEYVTMFDCNSPETSIHTPTQPGSFWTGNTSPKGSGMMSGVSKPTLQPSNTSFSSNFMSVPSQAPQTSSIPQVDTQIDEISSTAVKLPTPIASSSETFESTGLYLMDDGDKLWLYIGRYFNVNLLEELFGLPIHGREQAEDGSWIGGYVNVKPTSLQLNISSSELASRIYNIIQALRQHNWNKQELKVIWSGEESTSDKTRFSLRLVEDSLFGVASYADHLCTLHSKVLHKLP